MNRKIINIIKQLFSLIALSVMVLPVLAQNYPTRTVSLIVPSAPVPAR